MTLSNTNDVLDDYQDLLDSVEHRWRGRIIWLIVLAAIVAAGACALWTIVLRGDGTSTASAQTTTVQRGSITKTVSTSGTVVAQSTSNLSFDDAGTVKSVNVELGQEVKQGDVLAEVEADTLEDAVAKADVNLYSAQLKLNELLKGADASELASVDQSLLQAEANYEQAQRDLEDLLDGVSDSERLAAEQNVSSGQSNLIKAQDTRAKLDASTADAIEAAEQVVTKAESELADAEVAVEDAEDSVGSAETSLKSAETGYCLSPDYSSYADAAASFCSGRETPISSVDESVLRDVTVTGSQELAKEAASVLQANTSYRSALSQVEKAEDAVDLAEQDLGTAKADLADAHAGPTAEEIAAADLGIVSAQQALDAAVAKLNELYDGATESEQAQAQSSLDMAAASLTSAEAKWQETYDGADSEEIEQQRMQAQLAALSVEQARKDLEGAKLIAPFDGTVAEINVAVGEATGGAGADAAIILNTPDAVRINLSISESDMQDIEAGLSGMATFDSIDGGVFPITIESVGTNPTTTQGVVTYEAWASIRTEASEGTALVPSGLVPSGDITDRLANITDPSIRATAAARIGERRASGTPEAATTPSTDEEPAAVKSPLSPPTGTVTNAVTATPLPGMNASITIVVAQAQDVLVVPSSAIQTEGPNNVVEVQNEDGTTEKVVVETGLSDDSNIEIVSGLEEGQTIIIPVISSTSQSTSPGGLQGGIIIEGGGPPEGGGPGFRSSGGSQ